MDRNLEPWTLRGADTAIEDSGAAMSPRGDPPRSAAKPAPASEALQTRPTPSTPQYVKAMLLTIYDELFEHDGYATLKVEMRILRRGQKEVILDAGKQFRFVVEYRAGDVPGNPER